MGFSPIFLCFIKPFNQRQEENLNYIWIWVCLEQRIRNTSRSVQSCKEGYSRDYLQLCYRIWGVWKCPFHLSKITHSQPCLINIYDGFILQVYFEEIYGKLLPQDLISFWIGCQWNLSYFSISHLQIMLHHIVDKCLFKCLFCYLIHLGFYKINWINK